MTTRYTFTRAYRIESLGDDISQVNNRQRLCILLNCCFQLHFLFTLWILWAINFVFIFSFTRYILRNLWFILRLTFKAPLSLAFSQQWREALNLDVDGTALNVFIKGSDLFKGGVKLRLEVANAAGIFDETQGVTLEWKVFCLETAIQAFGPTLGSWVVAGGGGVVGAGRFVCLVERCIHFVFFLLSWKNAFRLDVLLFYYLT